MKKFILPAILLFSITIVSCRKERTCECKTTSTEVRSGFNAQTTVENSSTKATKAKQRKRPFKYSENCFSQTYSYNDEGGSGATAWSSVTTVETTCELD